MNELNFSKEIPRKYNWLVIFLALAFLLIAGLIHGQTLGQYPFSGLDGCSANNVSSQPAHATFSTYTSVGTTCQFLGANVFDRYGWNTSGTVNTGEYNSFTITPASGYVLNLTNITFNHNANLFGSCNWVLRSSLDNYTSNISSGSASSSSQTPSITLSSTFTNIGAVTFRFFVTGANSSGTHWVNDNVTVSGTVTLDCTNPSAPGNPTSNSPQCINNGVTITKSGSAPSGVTWYWQGTNSSGTSTAQNATSTYNATTSGTYYVRAQDNTGGCWSASSGSIAVTVNQVPTITLGINSAVCRGTTTANLTYSATTQSPDKYSIDYDATAEAAGFTDVTNATLPSSPITITVPSGAAAGTYNYTVTVKNNTTGCIATGIAKTITINALPTVSSTASPSAVVCSGTNVTLNGTGASTYTWTGGITNGTAFSATATTTYTVTGTDGNGCVNTATKTITVNTLPTVGSTVSPSATVCSATNVTLNGTGASTYTWTGGVSNNTAFSATATTTYTVTGTDANGCTNKAMKMITVNALPTVGSTVSPSATVCTGTSVTLSGNGASTYVWSGGVTDATAFLVSTTTTYNVTGTDANGCSNTTTKTINVGQLATVNAAGPDVALQSASPSAITLSGASVGGGATTGAWSIVSGGGTLSSTAQTGSPQSVTYTPAANYSGQVVLKLTTNSVICPAVNSNRIITVDPASAQTYYSSTTFTPPSCITSINVECWGAGGGGGANSQLADGGGGGGGGAYSKSTISVTPGTTYTVNVGTGGSGGTSGNDGGNGGDSWFINSTTILAKGGSKGLKQTGFLGTSGAGGSGGQVSAGVGTLKYAGGNGANGNNGLFGSGGGGGSSAGTAANGNNASSGNGGNAPAGGGNGGDGAYLSWGGAGIVPGGGGAGSSISLAGNGGAGAAGKVMISWSSSLAILGNAQSATNVCANTTNTPIHSFSLQGDNSCVTNLSFVTTGNYTSAEITNFKLYYTTTNTFSTSNLLATISSPATAGTQTFPVFSLPFSSATKYFWITMDVGNTITSGHTIAVNGTSASNLTASMVATGSASASGTQTLKPNVSISLTSATGTNNQTVCANTAITNINYAVGGGGTGASVTGLPSGVTDVYLLGVVGISGTPSVAGTYNYTVNTTGTCTQTSATGTIVVNPLPTVGSTVSPSATVCSGTSVTLNGTGATTYSWTGGVTNGTAFVPTSTTIYTVTGTGANGCVNTIAKTITINALPTVGSTVSPSVTVCAGTSVTLNGTGASTYSWTGGVTNGTAFVPTSTTIYTVTGTNANGCVNTATKTITVNSLPTVSATVSPSATVNIGTSVTLIGIGASSYSWTGGVINNSAFTPIVTTTYTVTGTDANGCSNIFAKTVTVNPLPPVGYIISPIATICAGTSVTLTGTGASTYAWSGGINDGVAFTAINTTTYTVTGTNTSGFSNTATVTVVVNPLPTITVSNPSPICNGGSTVLTTSGATTYSWSPATGLSAITGDIITANPIVTTTYTVTGTNNDNCTNTNSITVTLNPNCTNVCAESN